MIPSPTQQYRLLLLPEPGSVGALPEASSARVLFSSVGGIAPPICKQAFSGKDASALDAGASFLSASFHAFFSLFSLAKVRKG